MQARPDSRASQVLFADLLDTLGKQSMSSYRGRAANHSEALALAWLAAGPTEHLVVRGSHLLGPKNLRRLCTLTTACGVTTWLLDELHVNDGRAAARDALAAGESSVAELLAERALRPTAKTGRRAAFVRGGARRSLPQLSGRRPRGRSPRALRHAAPPLPTRAHNHTRLAPRHGRRDRRSFRPPPPQPHRAHHRSQPAHGAHPGCSSRRLRRRLARSRRRQPLRSPRRKPSAPGHPPP